MQPSASGTLITKIHRHEPTDNSSPPASGPSAVAIAPHAVQVPIAAPRSSGPNVLTITASELGTSSAPAIPWSARAATRNPMLGAIAQSTEANPKKPTPIANTLRSP